MLTHYRFLGTNVYLNKEHQDMNWLKYILFIIIAVADVNISTAQNHPLKDFNFSKGVKLDEIANYMKNNDFLEDAWLYYADSTRSYRLKDSCSFFVSRKDSIFERPNIDVRYTPITRLVYKINYLSQVDSNCYVPIHKNTLSCLLHNYGYPDTVIVWDNKVKEIYTSKAINDKLFLLLYGSHTLEDIMCFWDTNKLNISFYFSFNNRDDKTKELYSVDILNKDIEKLNIEEKTELKQKKENKEMLYSIIKQVLIVLVIVFALWLIWKLIKYLMKLSQKEREEREKLQKAEDYRYSLIVDSKIKQYGSISRRIPLIVKDEKSVEHHHDIFVFEDAKKVVIDNDDIDFDDIHSCTMYDENHKDSPIYQVSRTKTGSMLGRAAVGALTFGVAGAVVGAVTAKTETTTADNATYIGSYVVELGIKSINKPIIQICFGNDKGKAKEVCALMQAIIAMK